MLRCEQCGRATPFGCDPAHILAKGFGGGGLLDHPLNVVGLCRLCHVRQHTTNRFDDPNQLATERMVEIVAAREGVKPESVLPLLWEIRRKPKA